MIFSHAPHHPQFPYFSLFHTLKTLNPNIRVWKIAKFAPDRVCRGLGWSPLFLSYLKPGGLSSVYSERGIPSMGPGSTHLQQTLIWQFRTPVISRRTIHTMSLNFPYIDLSSYAAEVFPVLTNTWLHDATSIVQYGTVRYRTGDVLRGACIDTILCNIML